MSSNILNNTNNTKGKAPNITDYDNFGVAVICNTAFEKHTALTLKLRSTHLGAEVIVDKITPLLQNIINNPNILYTTPESVEPSTSNIDLAIARISNPKIPKIGVLPQEDSKNNIEGLEGIKGLEDLDKKSVLKALEIYKEDIEAQIKEVHNILRSTMVSRVIPELLELFEGLDTLSKYLIDTNYIKDYKDWKKLTKYIQKNCTVLKNTILTDDFMWYDDTREEFIMPIDINSSKIRIHKFFRHLTKAQIREANKIEKKYYKYIRDKIEIAKAGSEQLRLKNVQESKNPFAIVAKILSS